MEGGMDQVQDVWLKAQLRVKEHFVITPRRVRVTLLRGRDHLSGFSLSTTCLAMCKRDCLQTQKKVDTPITTANLSDCDHDHVILADCYVIESDGFLESNRHPLQMSHTIRVSASAEFLSLYGFYDEEIVWVRHALPLPLDRVILSLATPETLTSQTVKRMVEQLYSHESSVVVHQHYPFLHCMAQILSQESNSPTVGEDYFPTLSSSSSSSDQEYGDLSQGNILRFDVLETAPIVQGAITSKTRIFVVPSLKPQQPSHDTQDTTILSDDIFKDESTPSPVLLSSHPRSISLSSASDFRFDDSGQYDVFQSPKEPELLPRRPIIPPAASLPVLVSPPPAFTLPAVAAANFKQKYHFVLLPKRAALEHGIHDLQIVLIAAEDSTQHQSPLRLRQASPPPPSPGLVLPLRNVKDDCGPLARHLVVTKCYETETELEQYVSQVTLGRRYIPDELNTAYLHPELLFSLFPETLPLSQRTYRISIETLKATPSPVVSPISVEVTDTSDGHLTSKHPLTFAAKTNCISEVKTATKVTISFINTPDIPSHISIEDVVLKYLLHTKMMIKAGDVFSIDTTEYGRLFMRMEEVESSHQLGATVDASTRVSLLMRNAHSFRVDYVPLSSLTGPISYWEHLRPPGLEQYCNALFTHFLPSLSSCHHTPAGVLISGPPGVGKKTIVRAVARQCRMNIIEFNCYNFCGDNVASAEKKLKIAFDQAVLCAPCVMVLKEVHVLTRDMESASSVASQEPRMSLAFEVYVQDIAKTLEESNHQYPIILVGMTSRPGEVPARVQQYFLHEVKVTPPTQDQRLKMLQALIATTPTSAGIDLMEIARRSAGFVLGDLVSLLSQAFQKAYWDTIDHYVSLGSFKFRALPWNESVDVNIAGIMITKQQLDSALSSLHSTHSDYLGAPKIPSVQWKDVGGLETAKREILETIQLPLHHPELFTGGLRRSGILLYGAPGTGKTLLAKAVATECSLNFLSVKGPEIINMYVGQSEENIREVFARARSAAPCVIFFDELDSIAPNRGKSGDSGGVMDRVVSQLLAELDGMNRSKDVFIIGATNRPDLIDPALLRPGRFDRLVYLDVSDDAQSRLTILTAITRKFSMEGVDLGALADKCPNHLTGADLYALCADAMLTSLRRQVSYLEEKGLSDDKWNGRLTVCQEDFELALKQLRPSIKPEELEKYRSLQNKIA